MAYEFKSDTVVIALELSAHDDGYSVYDWFRAGAIDEALDAATPAAADAILSAAYLGADAGGVTTAWHVLPA